MIWGFDFFLDWRTAYREVFFVIGSGDVFRILVFLFAWGEDRFAGQLGEVSGVVYFCHVIRCYVFFEEDWFDEVHE